MARSALIPVAGLARAAALALLLAAAAAPAPADDLPPWPHEQQAALEQVEDDALRVQRKLFKARQQGDAAAVEALTPEYRTLQDRRRQLIESTRDQLPSQ